jgi:sugar lactone lactonase YvrE
LKLSIPNESPEKIADFLEFVAAGRSIEYFTPGNFPVNPFAMLLDQDTKSFYVSDGASGEIWKADLNGQIETVSKVEGHPVITGITWGLDGHLYATSFSQLPHLEGSGSIVRIEPNGDATLILDDLTTPIDLTFDRYGNLYVLEFAVSEQIIGPYRGRTGRLIRFERGKGSWVNQETLLDELPYPTAMLVGPEDDIYISINGAFSPGQVGQVIRYPGLVKE